MQVTLRIRRFNPERDQKPYWGEYTLDKVEPNDRVLELLHRVKWEQDGTLTFRRSCAHGVCGSDGMRINGVNRLACKVLVSALGTGDHVKVQVEPMLGLPVIDRETRQLRFHTWYPGCPMEEDAYGIPKPKGTEVVVPTLLFVPCVGYGPNGYRLGYGGGFYDRTLATLQPQPNTVGLGYSNGWLPDFIAEPHDIPLHAILSDTGVVWQD